MNYFSSEELLRKARALETAIFDKRLEASSGQTLKFFFDADIVVGAFANVKDVIALADREPDSRALTERDMNVIVRTLWVTGHTCKARLLYPHQEEVVNVIQSARTQEAPKQPEMLSSVKTAVMTDQQWRHLAQTRARQAFSAAWHNSLSNALAGSEPSAELIFALSNLLPLGHLALAVVSLGSWTDRMQLVGDRLVLHTEVPEGYKERLSVNTEAIARLCVDLQAVRKRGAYQRGRSVTSVVQPNTLADVCALVELDHEMKATHGYARFYTSTRPLMRLLDGQSEGLLQSLSGSPLTTTEQTLDIGVLDRPHSPFRSTAYMFLRSLIPSLSFPDRREVPAPSELFGSLEIDDLERMVESARSLVPSSPVGRLLWWPSAAKRGLAEFFGNVEAVTGFSTVWARSSDSKSIEFLKKRMGKYGQFNQSVETLVSQHDKIETSEKITDASFDESMHKIYDTANDRIDNGPSLNREMSQLVPAAIMRASGVGRWLALVNSSLVPIEAFSPKVIKWLGQCDVTRVVGHDWHVEDARHESNSIVLLMYSAFAMSAGAPSSPLCDDQIWESIRTRVIQSEWLNYSATILRQCTQLSMNIGEPPPSFQSLADQTIQAASELFAKPNEDTRAAAHVMAAWRAFYWCHAQRTCKHERGTESKASSETANVASGGLVDLQEVERLGNATHRVRWLMLADAVKTMLQVFAGERVKQSTAAPDMTNIYTADARAFVLSKQAILNEEEEKCLREVVRMYETGAIREPYLHAHNERYRVLLRM